MIRDTDLVRAVRGVRPSLRGEEFKPLRLLVVVTFAFAVATPVSVLASVLLVTMYQLAGSHFHNSLEPYFLLITSALLLIGMIAMAVLREKRTVHSAIPGATTQLHLAQLVSRNFLVVVVLLTVVLSAAILLL